MNDVNGKKLAVGDWVNIPARILEIEDTPYGSNMTVEFKYKMDETGQPTILKYINTKQVTKLE